MRAVYNAYKTNKMIKSIEEMCACIIATMVMATAIAVAIDVANNVAYWLKHKSNNKTIKKHEKTQQK